MNDKDAIFINKHVKEKFQNYLLPELPNLISHRIINNPEVFNKYFREHITVDYILLYLTNDDELLNGLLKEDDIINKIIGIVEEGKLYA